MANRNACSPAAAPAVAPESSIWHRELEKAEYLLYRDYDGAVKAIGNAMACAERTGTLQQVTQTCLCHARLLCSAGVYSAALAAVEKARKLALQCSDPLLAIEVDLEMGRTLFRYSKFAQAALQYTTIAGTISALEQQGITVPCTLRIELLRGRTDVDMLLANLHEAVQNIYACLYQLRDCPLRPDEDIAIAATLANVYVNLEDNANAFAFLKELQRKAQQEHNNFYHAYALIRRAQLEMLAPGNSPLARRLVSEAAELAAPLRSPNLQMLMLSVWVYIHMAEGNNTQAWDTCSSAVEMARKHEKDDGVAIGLGFLGQTKIAVGMVAEGLQDMQEGLAIAESVELPRMQVRLHQDLARVYETELQDPTGALYHLKQAAKLSEHLWGPEQQRRIARTQLNELLQRMQTELSRKQELYIQARREADLKTAELAKLALSISRKDDALRKARTELARAAARYSAERVQRVLDAIDSASETGSTYPWEVFERQFREVHGDFSAALLRRCPKISPAELKVCTLLRTGLSSKEIAVLLNMSGASVDVYRYRIRKKLVLAGNENLASFLAAL